MARLAHQFILGSALLLLSACASSFRSDVTSFHDQPVPTAGRVSIIPMDETKLDSIEYQQYAIVLAQNLQRLGFTPAGDQEADLVIGFDVAINDGREKIETRPGSLRSSFYWNANWRWGRYWGPYYSYDPFFQTDELVARTIYNVQLMIEIRQPDGTKIYEARADSDVRHKSVPEAMPLLAEALFSNFPGENGKTKRVKIDLEDRP